MTKIILLFVLSVALGVNAGTLFRAGRNIVEVPVEIVKEPITIELIKEEVVLPVEQLRVTDDIKIEEPVAVVSEQVVNNEENRVETIVAQEAVVPQLKAEVEEPVVVDVVETVKTIVPAEEAARVETVVAPVEAEQKVEILEAVEPGVKTTVVLAETEQKEEEQTPTELRQAAEAAPPQAPGLVGALTNIIQNSPIGTFLNNRVTTAAPVSSDAEVSNAEPAPAAPVANPQRPNIVQQFTQGLQNVGQQIANTLNGGGALAQTPVNAESGETASRPTLLENIQTTFGNILRPQAAPVANAPVAADAAGESADVAATAAEKPATVAAPAPAGPLQNIVSSVQNLLNRNGNVQRKPAADSVAKPVQPAVEKAVEVAVVEEEPAVVVVAKTEEEVPKKEE